MEVHKISSVILAVGIIIVLVIEPGNGEDLPTYCNCVPAAFCPNYGEGSIRPRDNNQTRADCPEGQKFCCINVQPPPPVTEVPILPPQPFCGIQKSSRVPGFNRPPSDLADFGEFPWLVRILGHKGQFLGSGALVGDSTVITVAHIFGNGHKSYFPESVVLGEWNDAVDVRPYKPVEIPVKEFLIHKDYNSANLRNDIAIVHLASPVDFEQRHPNIGPVCLPHHNRNYENHKCVLSTYGDDEFPIVRKIHLPIVPSSSCENTLKKTILGPGFILDSDSFVCAGGEPGKDACKGHGGAPLVCKVEDHFEVVGLVSWGLTDDFCNGKGLLPGVYAKVHTYNKWIKDNL